MKTFGAYLSDNKDCFEFVNFNEKPTAINFSLSEQNPEENIRILQLKITNKSDKDITINSLLIQEYVISDFNIKEVLENGWQQCSFSGYRKGIKPTKRKRLFLVRDQNPFSFKKEFGYLEGSMVNEWYTQLVGNNKSIAIGAITTKNQFTQIYLRQEGKDIRVRITCQLDGVILRPGRKISSEKIVIITGPKKESLETFAQLLKNENKIKNLAKPIKGLCCAYYAQGNKVDERYILDQLETIDRLPGKINLNFIQIDAGCCVWGDWLDTQKQFPSGMGFIVKEIKKRGIKAGIWIAPFVASPKSKLFNEHPDWFLKDDSGKHFEGRFTSPIDFLQFLSFRALDPTHPKVQERLIKVIKQFVEWGFELIKTDFTYSVCFSTNYHKKMTRAQALRKGFEVIRKAAGKKALIQNGITPLSPLVGILNFCRVGLDTVNPFVYPLPIFRNLVNNYMLSENLRNCITRQFLSGKIWLNDADCLVYKLNSGINEKLIKKHEKFSKNNNGTVWLGDNLSLLPWERLERAINTVGLSKSAIPAISVVIPAYNEEKTVSKTLDSLTLQNTILPFEVIFVDNNCTDKTTEIVNTYKNSLNLNLICEKNQGISNARNAGFSQSKAEIIASTDSDSAVPKKWVSSIMAAFWRKPETVGLVGNYIFESKGKIFNLAAKLSIIIGDYLHRFITKSFAFRGTNFAVRKIYWEKAGKFNQNKNALEDVDLSLRVGRLGKINYLPNLTVTTTYRRFHGRFIKQLKTRAKAYIYVLLNKNRDVEWEKIR
ncbi:hypothetical protein A2961_03800 [Candidatus Woesebacteria bacterium RIFCSPLOWO2_01_FULL_39_21]|uniref:Glycosyltransferase 2-like domain-containing protein n=1 Tax=Candidatus Woesebacteria bacterium RIFCSPLOWO2_01_FULL_39_21 TaxID=1802519 RepID=A0A1F8BCZ1_9BACT|nr:MAG: hypothetical protein A2961_03800 [Candidatus Woesebacteria bacterium RIFCSPLOWO2_01_FULL_39_21]